jgi:hypothetical protein
METSGGLAAGHDLVIQPLALLQRQGLRVADAADLAEWRLVEGGAQI